jgi:hypothetical protein
VSNATRWGYLRTLPNLCKTVGRDEEDPGVLSGLSAAPDPFRHFLLELYMVSAQSAVLSSAVPAVSAPTRLRLPDLMQATDRYADAVLSGSYDHLIPAGGPPTDDRWFTRLHGDEELDVWLISWVPDRSTELHDHGGSLGALTVVSGALRETRWDGQALRRRRLRAGDQAAFPLGWVHDVVWTPERDLSAPVSPTLSVHAYSPPLTAMSYYQVTERKTLRRNHTELTDVPEG